MPLYRYKALNTRGELLDGQMEAANDAEVVLRLQEQGHLPVEASVQRHVDRGHASVCEVGEDAVPAVDHPTDEGVRHAGRHRRSLRADPRHPAQASRGGRAPADLQRTGHMRSYVASTLAT